MLSGIRWIYVLVSGALSVIWAGQCRINIDRLAMVFEVGGCLSWREEPLREMKDKCWVVDCFVSGGLYMHVVVLK